jgi:hypothetical protein
MREDLEVVVGRTRALLQPVNLCLQVGDQDGARQVPVLLAESPRLQQSLVPRAPYSCFLRERSPQL